MSSTSAEISALSAITTIDIYKRFVNKKDNPSNDVLMSKFFSLGWGIIAILFSLFFAQKENLIESINIVASLLYGNVLGIFLIAFFVKFIKSNNKSAIIIDHDIQLIDILSDSLMLFDGNNGVSGIAHEPTNKYDSMNEFLKQLQITYRRDIETGRPRVNKNNSRLDKEQKSNNQYYYLSKTE